MILPDGLPGERNDMVGSRGNDMESDDVYSIGGWYLIGIDLIDAFVLEICVEMEIEATKTLIRGYEEVILMIWLVK